MIHRIRLTPEEVQEAIKLYLASMKGFSCKTAEITFLQRSQSTGDPRDPDFSVFDGAEAVVAEREKE